MSKLFKRTKILATVGPAVNSEEKITELIMAGVNGCRFNFSHGTYEERTMQMEWVKKAIQKKGRSVATVQDIQGPKIRLGDLKDDDFEVKEGMELVLDSAINEHDGSSMLPVQYNLAEKVKIDEPIFLYDGKIKTKVIEKVSDTAIKVLVENSGRLASRKGLNLPETDFDGDILTEKDLRDIEFGAKLGYDYVALSFIQKAEDIENLRQILLSHNSTAQIIAKIETKRALQSDEHLEEIVMAADGIMVARGDMAVEAGAEVVPIVQRKLINLCRKHSKLCIVATQMLMSMVDNPEPTRAEVSDVANAVIQGADAVMLSDETAQGKYPVAAVKAMKKVILYTQNHSRMLPLDGEPVSDDNNYDAIAAATATLAEKLGADVIICQTASGATAAAMAARRPNLPILTVTSSERVAGQLALAYANSAFVRPYVQDYGLKLAEELKEKGYLKTRENEADLLVVILSGKAEIKGKTDMIRVRRI